MSNLSNLSIYRRNISMSDKRYEKIEASIRNSYPKSCILWIEEVKNSELEEYYRQQKLEIETERKKKCEELELFHGTQENIVNIIINNGFEPSANKRSAYGKGSYFAKNSSYSRDYAPPSSDDISFILICSVLVGEVYSYGYNDSINTSKHDNSVDNIKNPTIYVTPYKYGAVPRYVVAFYKNAK